MKKHLPYIFGLLLIVLTFLNTWWLFPDSHTLGDVVTYYYPRAAALSQSIHEYGDFLPLWNPFLFSGDPFLAKPSALNPVLGLLLLAMKPMVALHWNVIIATFLAGFFMYLFVSSITGDRRAGFVAAIAYMFSGFYLTTVIFYGWVVFANAYLLIPLLLFFLFKASHDRIFPNAVIAGVVLGFFIIVGSGIEFLYATVMVNVYLLVNLIGADFKKRLVNSLIIGLVIISVCVGVSAFKLFPVYEYQQSSIRGHLSWQEASGRAVSIPQLFITLVEPGLPKLFQNPSNKVGIVVLALAIFGIVTRPEKRITWFCIGVILVSLLLATGSFLLYLFWRFYPGWVGMRYASRSFLMLVPVVAVLAGIGAHALFEKLRKLKLSERQIVGVFVAVAVLLLLDLAVFGSGGQTNAGDERYKLRGVDQVLQSKDALQYLSLQRNSSIFRIHTYETKGIDWGTDFYNVPLHLEHIFGYDTEWRADYLNGFLAVAQISPAKLWGVLNVRYVTAREPINVPGFSLVDKFNDCTVCFPEEPAFQKAWGPYVYENEEVMPRAWLADSAILVVGQHDKAQKAIFSLLMLPEFSPKNTVIIEDSDLKKYTPDVLRRYKGVILAVDKIDQNDGDLLKSYRDTGGFLIPDIFQSQVSISEQDIKDFLESTKSSYQPLDDSRIETLSFSRKRVNVGEEQGKFLVLSERYAFFPGWQAADNDGYSFDIQKADGVISAVYLERPTAALQFEYKPRMFVYGMVLTIISFLGLFAYFGYIFIYKKRRSKASIYIKGN